MKPGEKASHPKGMKAIAGISAEHRALLNEYRMAPQLEQIQSETATTP
jgi:hypothetical protein